MALSKDVSLPRDHVPLFPARCVRCGCENPDSSYVLPLEPIGKARQTRSPSTPDSWEVPACRGCARRLRTARIVRGVLFVAYAVAAVAAYAVLFGKSGLWGLGRLGMWIWLGGFMLAWIIVAIFVPRAIATSEFGDRVEYEFTNVDYAREFCELNGGTWEG